MDPADLKDWLSVVSTAIAIGAFLYAWLTRGSKENADTLRGHSEKIAELSGKLQAIEAEWKHLPDAQMVNELKVHMAEVRGAISTQAEVTGSIARTVQRLESYLLEKGK